MLILIRSFLLLIAIFALTGCDKHLFNEIFRNPHIVEIAELDSLKANQWYEFDTNIKAINKSQEVIIDFLGSAPSELDSEIVGFDIYGDGPSRFFSTRFPDKDIIIEINARSSEGDEYTFHPIGQSSGIIYINKSDISIRGKVINSIKIKSNLDHESIKLTWISRTGK
ncbi:MAG: hypothetical protein ACI9OH_000460 [Oleispira sp.]